MKQMTNSSVTKFSIGISNWIYEQYLSKQPNKSRFIEQMILKGLEVDEEKIPEYKAKVFAQNEEIISLRNKVNNLSLQLEGWKSRRGKREMTPNEKMAESIKRRGLMG